jgi:CDP-paratose 2-epimerase
VDASATILVTGGAGFVGSNLALDIKRDQPGARVIAFDNLKRRGSELALSRLAAGGVEFRHGDIRNAADLAEVGAFTLLLECSAEPSVHAGYDGSPAYVIDTNLVGTVHCLEAARRHRADVVFLSTSRVYPIAALRALPLRENASRLALPPGARGPGWSEAGIGTAFPLAGARSMYGATKLASELILAEYGALYGLRYVVNRCGVIAGPWQMGKVDQGFLVLWAARHLFGGQLAYTGFSGRGLQVRDVLHVADLYELLRLQVGDFDRHNGKTYNVGGGAERSVSLRELSALCQTFAPGSGLIIGSDPTTRAPDIPYYVTDNAEVTAATGWAPRRSVRDLLADVFAWLERHRAQLQPILA